METERMYIVVSKLNNTAKCLSATDKHHALNKALNYFAEHTIKDLSILTKLKK